MTTLHTMSLEDASFRLIQNGSKTIELRLYDAKRQLIQLGDSILFRPATGLSDSVETEVKALLRYDSFDDLIDELPVEWFGGQDKEALKAGVYAYYSIDDVRKYGVLGIRIKVLKKEV